MSAQVVFAVLLLVIIIVGYFIVFFFILIMLRSLGEVSNNFDNQFKDFQTLF